MNYQRRYIERLAETIRSILTRSKKPSFKNVWARALIPEEFTKVHVSKFLKVCCEANVAEALGLLYANGRIKRVRPGCRAFGPAVYRRA